MAFTVAQSRVLLIVAVMALGHASDLDAENVFPTDHWATASPEILGVDEPSLLEVAHRLGGRGCIVKDGFVVHAWGDQALRSDWMSSAKPVISTLLFFALHEGLIERVDQPIADFDDRLAGKDRQITFRHLGSMTSGYRRPERPGEAWAYNDPAIQLYQLTLFDKVFRADPHVVSGHADRLGALQFEDGLSWSKDKRRLRASVRDFSRIAWFWLNRGRWHDRQLLRASYFTKFVRPQTPKDLPHTQKGEVADYLSIGSYGGGSDHFTKYGAGIYGFNWWFNDTGRLHPDQRTWPHAPPDVCMSIGAGGNCAALFPGLNMVLVCAAGNWGRLEAGQVDSRMNRILALTANAASDVAESPRISGDLTKWRPVTLDFRGPVAHAADADPDPFLDHRLAVEDFRKYESLWQCMAHARAFMHEHLPFWEMEPRDELLSGASEFRGKNSVVGGQVFAKQGEIYAVYLPSAVATGKLDLSESSAMFRQRWFNPRTGLFTGSEAQVRGGRSIRLGAPPDNPSEDWVILLTRTEVSP